MKWIEAVLTEPIPEPVRTKRKYKGKFRKIRENFKQHENSKNQKIIS